MGWVEVSSLELTDTDALSGFHAERETLEDLRRVIELAIGCPEILDLEVTRLRPGDVQGFGGVRSHELVFAFNAQVLFNALEASLLSVILLDTMIVHQPVACQTGQSAPGEKKDSMVIVLTCDLKLVQSPHPLEDLRTEAN